MAYFRQDLEASFSAFQKAVSLFREVDDSGGLGGALVFYGGALGMVYPSRYIEAISL
jgi:hypothetical protein